MKITCLGSGEATSRQRHRSSFMVNDSLLLDCPPEIVREMYDSGKDPRNIENIFISHFHGDHIFGLPFLFLEFRDLEKTGTVNIIGPPGIEERVERLFELAFPEVEKNWERTVDINYVEAEPGSELSLDGLSFQTYRMKHGHKGLDPFGYLIDIGEDKVLGYTGDTGYCDSTGKIYQNSDVLISECTYPQEGHDSHLNFDEVKELSKRFSGEPPILLTHLLDVSEEMRNFPDVELVKEGKDYKF